MTRKRKGIPASAFMAGFSSAGRMERFSRFNQPVPCRMCGRKTTWSESNGNCGLDLCKQCFDQASMENEHYDGHHREAPNAGCRLCHHPACDSQRKDSADKLPCNCH